MTTSEANLGWRFYKEYYWGDGIEWLNLKEKNENATTPQTFKAKSQALFDTTWTSEQLHSFVQISDKLQQLTFKTTYPGLLLGSGYTHETGALGEIKIGFYFDYTTGLPVIPGSSVKGLLRSSFETEEGRAYLNYLLQNELKVVEKIAISDLKAEIFEGRGKSNMYEHDIFYDAAITGAGKNNQIVGTDFITPHKHALKNPIPLQFLKVLPNVEWTFYFDLKDSKLFPEIKKEVKRDLFKQILLDFGIGAKTNVGYGQLVPTI